MGGISLKVIIVAGGMSEITEGRGLRLTPWESPTLREQKRGATGRGVVREGYEHRVTEVNRERGWSTVSNDQKSQGRWGLRIELDHYESSGIWESIFGIPVEAKSRY